MTLSLDQLQSSGSPAFGDVAPYYPTETPAAVIELEYLPSINDALDAYNIDRFAGAAFVDEWKDVGRLAVAQFGKDNRLTLEAFVIVRRDREGNIKKRIPATRLKEALTTEPVEIVLRVWRPDERIYDVHNVYIKPVLDGFVSANLFLGDDTRWIVGAYFHYEGVDRSLALTEEEKEIRAMKQAAHAARRERAGKKPNRLKMPVRARYRFEFYIRPRAQKGLF